MADWEGLTDEEKRIASAVYNKITDSQNAVDFDNELNASSGMNLLSITMNGNGYGAGYVKVATAAEAEEAIEEIWS